MELNDIPLLIEAVDLSRYKAANRKIHHMFNFSSADLVGMVINFSYNREIAIPSGHNRGWQPREAALNTLLDGGYVTLLYRHWHDTKGGKGRCRIYRRTDLFDKTFNFRLPPKLLVKQSSLMTAQEPASLSHNRIKVNSIPALSTYAKLIESVTLTRSDGGQVFGKITDLYRKDGKRIYAPGVYNYQSGITKEERLNLLINDEPTIELDFTAMHANIILNSLGEPSRSDFYERILEELKLSPVKENRSALKHLVNATFNASNRNYGAGLSGATDKDSGKRLIDMLGIKPKQMREAMLKAYPQLSPYICTGDHSDWLQTTDSEIMIAILETLAKLGVIGLPLHDSVIAQAKYRDLVKPVMVACYKKKTGFAPYIK